MSVSPTLSLALPMDAAVEITRSLKASGGYASDEKILENYPGKHSVVTLIGGNCFLSSLHVTALYGSKSLPQGAVVENFNTIAVADFIADGDKYFILGTGDVVNWSQSMRDTETTLKYILDLLTSEGVSE